MDTRQQMTRIAARTPPVLGGGCGTALGKGAPDGGDTLDLPRDLGVVRPGEFLSQERRHGVLLGSQS